MRLLLVLASAVGGCSNRSTGGGGGGGGGAPADGQGDGDGDGDAEGGGDAGDPGDSGDPDGSVPDGFHRRIFVKTDVAKLDTLWVIDNSGSMCQEQANLARNYSLFADQLAAAGSDVRIAVVTTDMQDSSQSGRFVNSPATENNLSCEQPCLGDADCGGGCLCGIGHRRRCAGDADCDDGQLCAAPQGGGIRHCALRCNGIGPANDPTSDKCGAEVRQNQVLTCQADPENDMALCLLTPCLADEDCNGGEGQRCLPSPEGGSFCRRFRSPRVPAQCTPGVVGQCPLQGECVGQPDGSGKCEAVGACPPPTCDCPKDLPKVLAATDSDDLERDFRCLATVGTKGDTFEKGLAAMRAALDEDMTAPGGLNEGFLRDDAGLAVLFLSDEDDCSDAGVLPRREGNECEHNREQLVPVADYVQFLSLLKPKRGAFVSAIVGPKDLRCVSACPSPEYAIECIPAAGCASECAVDLGDPDAFCADRIYDSGQVEPTCTSANGQAFAGRRYVDLANRLGGERESICAEGSPDGEFGALLGRIGEKLSRGGGDVYCLVEAPADGVADQLTVEVLTVPDDSGVRAQRPGAAPQWEFQPGGGPAGYGCVVITGDPPGAGEAVVITYPAEGA